MFNDHLRDLLNTLEQNEQAFLHEDIVNLLIQNYKLCTHEDFRVMLNAEIYQSEKSGNDLDYEDLMETAESKYDGCVKDLTWGKKTAQEEQLLALHTKINDLQQSKPSGRQNNNNSSNNAGSSDRTKTRKYADWQYVAPTDGRFTKKATISIRGTPQEVEYYWCIHHNDDKGRWVRHKPADCEVGKKKTEGAPTKKTEGAWKNQTAKLVSANMTIHEEDEDEDSE